MTWQRAVRVSVAILGVSLAGVIFVMTRREGAGPAPPLPLATLDPGASLQGGPGKGVFAEEGRTALEITYSASAVFDDGRVRYENATVLGLDEHASEVRADLIEASGKAASDDRPGLFTLTGNVMLRTTDGLVVEAPSATYDDNTGSLRMPGAVAFSRGRLSGTGTGATYDREQDTISLLADAVANVAADEAGRGAARATADRMYLVRGQRALRLEGQARIAGDQQLLTANAATVTFTEDERALKFLELRGSARAQPGTGAGENTPGMSADSITMSFQTDGITLEHATLTGRAELTLGDATSRRSIRASWIDVFTADDGRTVTSLRARDKVIVEIPATADAPRRTIRANELNATGAPGRGLTSARFEGSPVFEEVHAGPRDGAESRRTGRAASLVLALGGAIDAIERAVFQQNATFEDGEMSGWADTATYDEARESLRLEPNRSAPRRLSRVTNSTMNVDAELIDLRLQTQDMEARGSVTSRMVRDSSPPGRGALFEGDDPIYGSGATLSYTRERGVAVYTGTQGAPAQVRQGKTAVTGSRIEFGEKTSNLSAEGAVDSTMAVAIERGEDGRVGQPQLVRMRAETFSYDDAMRRAVYQGSAVMTTEDGHTEANMLTLELAPDSRSLTRLRAQGDVFTRLPRGDEAVGDTLIYETASEVYMLTGAPAKVKSRQESGGSTSCTLSVATTLTVNRRTGAVEVPGQGQAPRSTETIPCSTPIRAPR